MRKLYICNLPYSATDEILRHIFEQVGPVRSARIVTDAEGRSRGFGFVEMLTLEDAAEAIARFNSDTYDGRVITVAAAHCRTPDVRISKFDQPDFDAA